MAGSTNTADQRAAIPPPPSHIISRPRLTRLLDETTAKIMILVAPAGYGKTTLAQEWLRERPHVWYHANAASADVALLALDLAEALAEVDGAIPARMQGALAAVPDPACEISVLVDILQPGIDDDVVLAIDDYDAIARSSAAEQLISDLVAGSHA